MLAQSLQQLSYCGSYFMIANSVLATCVKYICCLPENKDRYFEVRFALRLQHSIQTKHKARPNSSRLYRDHPAKSRADGAALRGPPASSSRGEIHHRPPGSLDTAWIVRIACNNQTWGDLKDNGGKSRPDFRIIIYFLIYFNILWFET